jgi:hypothetical protein
MSATIALVEGQGEKVDRSALLLMLSYIEAECRRLGATAAAEHAALAASLVPGTPQASVVQAAPIHHGGTVVPLRRKRSARLH